MNIRLSQYIVFEIHILPTFVLQQDKNEHWMSQEHDIICASGNTYVYIPLYITP